MLKMHVGESRVSEPCKNGCRYTDAYAGKKAKLPDAALQNEAGKFVRYSKANWTFPGVNITIPAATADWSKFNLTNLPGEKTYPVVTTSILLTNNDLTGRGEHLRPLPHLSNTYWYCCAS